MEKPRSRGFSMNETFDIQKPASQSRKRNPNSVV
jgi:hypothetical protein